MPQRAISFSRLLAAILVWLALSVVVGYATFALLPRVAPAWASDIGRLSAAIVAEVYGLLIISLWVVLPNSREALRVRPINATAVTAAAGIWIGAYALTLVLHFAISAVHPAFPSPSELLSVLRFIGTDMGRLQNADAATWILAGGRATVLAPLGEELLFRGALFGWLRQRLSAWPTILLTAIAFAGIHAGVPTLLGLALVIGAGAGYVRERFGSVTPVVVVHVLHNVLLVLAAFVL
jgi:membrane protease YdiL (CAAX protease family)